LLTAKAAADPAGALCCTTPFIPRHKDAPMSSDPLPILRDAWLAEFGKQKAYIDGALGQLTDAQFRARPAPNINSAAIIIKHLAGNLRSRWTDWLATDGEKPDRNRDDEFVDRGEHRATLMERYEAGFGLVFAALNAMTPSDLTRTITIRAEPHAVPLAINRSLAHCAYHAGQIMVIGRWVAGDEVWKWQTVPPGGSAGHNADLAARFKPRP
jgi:hypothetical protein